MGADIHGVLQSRFKAVGGSLSSWTDEGEVEDSRNYSVFAALANVRNYCSIKPISDPRGLPDDFEMKDEAHPLRGRPVWMGGHSFTWLTLEEIRDWPGWDQSVKANGCISRKQYEEWDGTTTPYPYSMSIGGGGVVLVNALDSEPQGDWTHIRVYWTEPLRVYCEMFLEWVDYAASKCGGYDKGRIVIGFDN